ncbi:MAG: hypothetical protein ACTSYE_05555 [Alphaproteobacteria bacterium]
MTDLLRLLLLVPLGYIAAVLAAALTLAITAVDAAYGVGSTGTLFVAMFLLFYVGAITFLPWLLAVAAAELFAIRSVLFYLITAGLLGYAVHSLAPFSGGIELFERRALAFPVAGFVGGFVYWLIAGRRAGFDRGPPAATP